MGSGNYRESGISTFRFPLISSCYDHFLPPPSVFYQCGCYQEALDAFEKASCWEMVFVCSSELRQSIADRMQTARRVAGEHAV
jgi:hypothetical protein